MKLYSVIIPIFNEFELLMSSYMRVKGVMDTLNNPYELIFVDDGSIDGSYDILKEIAEDDANAKVLVLSRNFGHQTAVTAGMKISRGDAVIIIDGDMQDPPELIPDMLRLWKQGYEIVYGKRKKRLGETFMKKFTASAYYKILNKLSDGGIPEDAGDFRLLDRKVVDVMNRMPEHNRYLRGMSAWAGFKQYPLEYVREERKEGKSKYTLRKMLRLASDGAISMSGKLLKYVGLGGMALTLIGNVGLITAIIIWILYGLPSVLLLASLMGFFTGLLLLALGILGAYIGRIYDETKGRPLYVIKETFNYKE